MVPSSLLQLKINTSRANYDIYDKKLLVVITVLKE